MREIPLTRGYVALIDDDLYEHYAAFSWWAKVNACTVYARNKQGYMHRIIMNAPKGIEVDHIDHNGLNNQRSNLRLATRSQNLANTKCHSDSKSAYKGIWKDKGSWTAEIAKEGRRYRLGSYATEIEAARRYDIEALKMFNEFAQTNGISTEVIPIRLPPRYRIQNGD